MGGWSFVRVPCGGRRVVVCGRCGGSGADGGVWLCVGDVEAAARMGACGGARAIVRGRCGSAAAANVLVARSRALDAMRRPIMDRL